MVGFVFVLFIRGLDLFGFVECELRYIALWVCVVFVLCWFLLFVIYVRICIIVKFLFFIFLF